jgi:hypothetical protein
MRRDFPPSGNGVDAPRLVVFEVINLKPLKRRSPMEQITRAGVRGEAVVGGQAVRVGVDLAKRVIQVYAVDGAGRVRTTGALPCDKFIAWSAQFPAGCVVAMETSSGAHHWARKLIALGLDARIIAAQLVSPYRRQGASGKNDANDAEPGHKQS